MVGEILVLRDVGFTLREVKALITARSSGVDGWRELRQRKLAELDQRIAHAQAARTAIARIFVEPAVIGTDISAVRRRPSSPPVELGARRAVPR